MAGFRLIDLARPIQAIVPEIEIPYEKVSFDDKLIYTFFTAILYLLCQFPLASMSKEPSNVKDPIFFLRGVFASEPKSLMEFGLFPIIASSIILQLLAGIKIVNVNFKSASDRKLFQTFTKVLSMLLYIILANIFIFSGYYGEDLTVGQMVNLNFQLASGGMFTILLAETVDKGYGFVSGIMTINTIVSAANLVTDTFAFNQIPISNEDESIYEAQGAFINFVQSLWSGHRSYLNSVTSAFSRDYLPNLTTALSCFVIGAIAAYLFNVRFEVPVRSTQARGVNNMYPVRLLNIGCLSILYSYTLLFFIHISSFALIQLVAKNDPEHIICKILGHYQIVNNILYVPSFPLSMLTPPRSIKAALLSQPLTLIVLPLFIVLTGAWFALKWQAISGNSSRDIANDFKEQGITLVGRREQNVGKELEKVIPVASVTGAVILGLITVAAELLGLKGKGAGIIIGVSGAFALLEVVTVEFQQSGGQSMLAQYLGGSSSIF